MNYIAASGFAVLQTNMALPWKRLGAVWYNLHHTVLVVRRQRHRLWIRSGSGPHSRFRTNCEEVTHHGTIGRHRHKTEHPGV
jgi:hypothetical protein